MKIQILGAHNIETRETRLTSLLVDGILALDAGSLSSGLSIEDQCEVKAVLLTHRHFDHVRDLLTMGIATKELNHTVDVYGIKDTVKNVTSYLMNGKLYPDFTKIPSTSDPKYKFHVVEPGNKISILGYNIIPIIVPHGPPSIGYLVSDNSAKLLYTGDTGAGLAKSLAFVQPDLIIVEVTFCNRFENLALTSGHMTPNILFQELSLFSSTNGYLPKIVVIHMHPGLKPEITKELKQIALKLEAQITLGIEDMVINL